MLAAGLLLVGCSSIQIDQDDVFQSKPTVTPATFDVEGVQLEEVFFSSAGDSLQLNAWHLTQPDAQGTVLFFGGNGFFLVHASEYIRALMRLPVNVFMVDYRGYGQSEGQASIGGLKSDALQAYQYLTEQQNVEPNRLIVHGHSMGTFVALHTATQRPVAGVVLENPATNADDWASALIPWYLRLFISFDVTEALEQEDNLERIRRLNEPVLLFGGEEDQVTAPEMARELHEVAAPKQKQLVMIEGGQHNGLYETSAYQNAYEQFLRQVLE